MECRHWREDERAYCISEWTILLNAPLCSVCSRVLLAPKEIREKEYVKPNTLILHRKLFFTPFLLKYCCFFYFTKQCFTVFIFGWKQFNLHWHISYVFHYISLFSPSWPNLEQLKSLLLVHFRSRAGCDFLLTQFSAQHLRAFESFVIAKLN